MSQNPYSPQPPQPQQPQQAGYPQQAYAQWPQGYPPPLPPRSKWPTVIGVISIVFAGIGLLCLPFAVLGRFINPAQKQVYQYLPSWYPIYETFSYVLGVGFAVLLLVGGILLLKRRPAGRTLHLAYAVAATVMAVFGTILMTMSISRTGNMPPPMRYGFIGGAIGGMCGGLAYPIFLLVWFLRAPIAAEARGWGQNNPG
ncbi:MAG TPA: hypothetical protein VM389_06270 [Phycisphaerae bacterium]|nr:hypothetical protein [Phycisphaerae bacterium]